MMDFGGESNLNENHYPDAEAVALNNNHPDEGGGGGDARRNSNNSNNNNTANNAIRRINSTKRRSFCFLMGSLLALTLVVLASTNAAGRRREGSLSLLFSTSSRQEPSEKSATTTTTTTLNYPAHIPEIAWIMSLGGSGTSYTVLNTEQLSGCTTASNYGGDYQPCWPVHPDSSEGPYVRSPQKPFPSRYILTKTHCGGFCMDCPPAAYVYPAAEQFQESCFAGRRRWPNGTREHGVYGNGGNNQQDNNNSTAAAAAAVAVVPTRAVHMVRHPFDNIVGRMHLAVKHHRQREHQQELRGITDDQAGLLRWCDYLDAKFRRQEVKATHLFPAHFMDRYGTVPCHAEWFRYVQWHNWAAAVTTDRLNIPVHYLFYDNYTAAFDETVARLFAFLELDVRAGAAPYEWHGAGKTYADYLPPQLQAQAASMMKDLATPATWKLIRHYLEPYLTETNSSSDNNNNSNNKPQVAWLMSFPNSGTSYTLNNVALSTGTTTASNYARDWETIVPVRPEWMSGPFLQHPDRAIVPHTFVLTKTHCGGYCIDCPPRSYVLASSRDFLRDCLRAERPGNDELHYDASVPSRIVHLIRNPFDNLVARLHLDAKNHRSSDIQALIDDDLTSKETFDAWCLSLDQKFLHEERTSHLFADEIKAFFWDLPCHAEWYRYVQWHNLALASVRDHLEPDIPVHYLHYEDYAADFNATAAQLLDFLQLDWVHDPAPFRVGRTYVDTHYDAATARKAAAFVQALATPATWQLVERYFLN